jgi:hypothetical protein
MSIDLAFRNAKDAIDVVSIGGSGQSLDVD